jgi:predicted transcriptional regulator of viral defense system
LDDGTVLDLPDAENGLIIVGELARQQIDDRQLRSIRGQKEVRRIRRGVYTPTEVLEEASRDQMYSLRIGAVVATRRSRVVVSHYSAARLWALPIVNPWPHHVHITVPPDSGKRSKNGVVVHREPLESRDVVELGGMSVTDRTRTLIDLARFAPFRDAVAALDAALAAETVESEELSDELKRVGNHGGSRRAARAIEFASPQARSPGESYSRVLMFELGFPPPELQHEFTGVVGGRRFSDFWWEDIRLAGEFDGRVKYTDPKYTHGRTAEQVVWDEKRRQNVMNEGISAVARWDWEDLDALSPFIRRLEAAGLHRRSRFPL